MKWLKALWRQIWKRFVIFLLGLLLTFCVTFFVNIDGVEKFVADITE